mmetsp:Transcript_31791/g.38420  ORF Transcript_31791/g.38420 Transcript_31791/m.38420 type:complete len:849 (+) Transcript_31791:246-2792(+)
MSTGLDSRVFSHLAASARSSSGDQARYGQGQGRNVNLAAYGGQTRKDSRRLSTARAFFGAGQHRLLAQHLVVQGTPQSYKYSCTAPRRVAVPRRNSFHCSASEDAETTETVDATCDELWEDELVEYIQHLPEEEKKLARQALETAYFAHDGQRRKSGEPFIIHPVACACILGDMQLDVHSICAGLLHDTVEDTDRVTFESIQREFGVAVRRIVEGETKVSKVSSKVRKSGGADGKKADHAEDLQQMFLAMTQEVRIIIVKLADRLHNMRTLGHMPRHKQKAIAEETLQVFAPLAHLLGMNNIKKELEGLSFRYMDPDTYAEVSRYLDVLAGQQEGVVLKAKEFLEDAFAKDEFLSLTVESVDVQASMKAVYSIHRKTVEEGKSLNDIREVAQLCIVLKLKDPKTVSQLRAGRLKDYQQYGSPAQVCYHALGLIHNIWPPVPGRMKDYIATPKPNGYRSLHTTVMPLGVQGKNDIFPLELLIRTDNMHHVAQVGIAAQRKVIANWHDAQMTVGDMPNKELPLSATEVLSNKELSELAEGVKWLNSIREWQDEFLGNMTPMEFVDTITGDLLGRRVFAFTPSGEVLNLPKGATVVDYAYTIHTDVGNRMVAAKVNGNLVCPSHVLKNAEVVEIITYNGPPSNKSYQKHKEWLKHATTRVAYFKIKKFVREYEEVSGDVGVLDVEGEVQTNGAISSNGASANGASSNGASSGLMYPNGSEPQEKESTSLFPSSTVGKYASSVQGSNGNPSTLSNFLDPVTGTLDPTKRFLFSVKIKCQDRNGLLADVSGTITENGLSIKKYYGGGGLNQVTEGDPYHMNFEVWGKPSDIPKMCAELDNVTGVIHWNCSCIE